MIHLVNDYGVEPRAIEQALDLSIPQNKMMLIFYLAAPEVEKGGRALNIFIECAGLPNKPSHYKYLFATG